MAARYGEINGIYRYLVHRLIQRRLELGLTQVDLDERAGWAERLASKYEACCRAPSLKHLMLWMAALNLYVDVDRDAIKALPIRRRRRRRVFGPPE